jgi:hypothetical protein
MVGVSAGLGPLAAGGELSGDHPVQLSAGRSHGVRRVLLRSVSHERSSSSRSQFQPQSVQRLGHRLGFVGLDDGAPDADPAVITGYKAARNRPLTRGQKLSIKALAADR